MEYDCPFPKRTSAKRRRVKSSEEKGTEARFAGLRKGPCQACRRPGPCDVEHIRTRGSGGTDAPENTWAACRVCHNRKGAVGINRFATERPAFAALLLEKGWKYSEYRAKWILED